MFVKLCGLRRAEDVEAAIAAEASALGFILSESKRRVDSAFVAAVRSQHVAPPTLVGVTVNESPATIETFAEDAKLDMIQLSGDEDISVLDHIHLPVIKALRFPAGTSVSSACAEVDRWLSHRFAPELVIVDGHAEGSHGGTGTKADWRFVHEIATRFPIVLAGGLDPGNVAEAIRTARPIGVDVSSGIETDAVKDPVKMQTFVQAARHADDGPHPRTRRLMS